MIKSLNLACPNTRSSGLVGEAGRGASDVTPGFKIAGVVGVEGIKGSLGAAAALANLFAVAFELAALRGRASDAVVESVGIACEEDTTGSDVPLVTGITPLASSGSFASVLLGVESVVDGAAFRGSKYGLVEGRFWTNASVDLLARPGGTTRARAGSLVGDGTVGFGGITLPGVGVDLEAENKCRESGRFWPSVS